nr:uncharacterized protein LOC131772458 [Pocillopora verrucosa]
MSTETASSSSSPNSPVKSTMMCGQFLFLEFLIFFVIFLVGFASNILFILLSCKTGNNSKSYSKNCNDYLLHCSIANLILMVRMPFDIISFTTNGSWFFGEYSCSLHFFVERAIYIAIATHIMNMARDAYTPFGFPTQPSSCTTNWVMSLVFAFPLLFTSLVRIPGRCTRCTLINNSLGRMPVFQWTEYLYVAILPVMTVCFYCNKFGVHPDYEALDKADPDDHNGQTKMKLRRICLTLATTIFICTSPARLTEIAGGNFELWPGSRIIFFFIPRLLIYGQTIIFSVVCAFSFPSFYQEAKIATKRICSCRIHRLIQHKTLTEQ